MLLLAPYSMLQPGMLMTAVAELYHDGASLARAQDQEVQVQYLCCPGSADDMIWSIVNAKLRVVGATLDGHTAGTAAGAALRLPPCALLLHALPLMLLVSNQVYM